MTTYTLSVSPMQQHIASPKGYPMTFTDAAYMDAVKAYLHACEKFGCEDNMDDPSSTRLIKGDTLDAGGIGHDYRIELRCS